MSYKANQYNYATPLHSAVGFLSDTPAQEANYFTLSNNTLDGSYQPISGDVGLWGTSLPDADGLLAEPFVVTVEEPLVINAFKLTGSEYNYPVAFTVAFYNGATLLYTITENSNASAVYMHYMPRTLTVTSYVITVLKISDNTSVARLYRATTPSYVKRSDPAVITLSENSIAGTQRSLHRTDHITVGIADSARFTCRTSASDSVAIVGDERGALTNVHTKMKEPSRRIYGKVYITYTDPMLDNELVVDTNMDSYNSNANQLTDNALAAEHLYFTLYDNDLSGRYSVMSEDSQVGAVSMLSNSDGTFTVTPYLRISFSSRPVTSFAIYFDDSHGNVAADFTVHFHHADGAVTTKTVVGNTASHVEITGIVLAEVVAVEVRIDRSLVPNMPVSILELPMLSTVLYRGYQDQSDIMSISLLEELTYNDEVEALGGISANEVTVVLDNSNSDFYFNNQNSAVSQQLRRNRKIEPWLGVEVAPGTIEWYKQGVFWSYRWNVPVKSLVASVVGFDTIGLLDKTDFVEHQVHKDWSIGQLIDYILSDAKRTLHFLEWRIDEALYDVTIPYAWFAASSHTAALRKLSAAFPMHVYCDKNGVICAAPQKLHLDEYYDTWSDSTNVISKEYSSLYTTLPNIINVTVKIPHEEQDATLVQDNLEFSVSGVPTRTLNFSKPLVSDLVVNVDKDSTVSYTYAAYSWGIVLTFSGAGKVRSIQCSGTAINVSNTSTLTRRDENSIHLNGAVTRDVSADFIQTSDLAALIINRIFTLSEHDKYDATVVYRGDIALTINDPIRLLDGIAPDNRYNIRRHQLTWNGALSGTADLNT